MSEPTPDGKSPDLGVALRRRKYWHQNLRLLAILLLVWFFAS